MTEAAQRRSFRRLKELGYIYKDKLSVIANFDIPVIRALRHREPEGSAIAREKLEAFHVEQKEISTRKDNQSNSQPAN
jgi:hypothetical protein